MRRYSLARVGSLLITRAALSGPAGTKVLNLLVDTGSTYTVAAVEAIEAVGCSPVGSKEHVRIVTGSGHVVAPLVKIPPLQCLGHKIPILLYQKRLVVHPCREFQELKANPQEPRSGIAFYGSA